MSKLLGANWKSTIWGAIFALSTAISAAPALIAPLPDDWESYVRMAAGLIVAASGVGFAASVKSREVTGGTMQQTSDGSVAAPPAQASSSSVTDTKNAAPKE